MSRVVVGVDGSKMARAALSFAANEARMRGARLEVVYVQEPPRGGSLGVLSHGIEAEYVSGTSYAAMVQRDQEEREQLDERARQHGEQLLVHVVDAVDTDGIDVEQTLLFDRRPARRLVELVNDTEDVELLVVGSRGLGELRGALLGSVSQACAAHARVPVTVVHTK